MNKKIKNFLPKKLLARLLLIFLVPLILTQSLVVFFFYDRHWEKIINRFSNIASNQVGLLINEYKFYGIDEAKKKARILSLRIGKTIETKNNLSKSFFEKKIQNNLENRIDRNLKVFFDKDSIELNFDFNNERLFIVFPRKYLLSETPTILFLWMIFSSLVLSLIAFLFLRIQVRAIHRLANSAEEFGKGRFVKRFKPEGATEIRMAGNAFMKMRRRIRNYISERTNFLAGISHDLGTIITRIKLQLEIMRKSEAIDSIKNDIDTMQIFLKEYLDYSEKIKITKISRVNIYKLLNEILNSDPKLYKRVNLKCRKTINIKINKNNLFRIIFNLIENASKYGKKILVEVKRIDNNLMISVEDDGPGVPDKFKKKIFRPFFKIDKSRNLNEQGSGLGLSIANELVKKLNGNIIITASKKLKGSCFTIKIQDLKFF